MCCQFVAVKMSQLCHAVCCSICTKPVTTQEREIATLRKEASICAYPSHAPFGRPALGYYVT